MTLVWCLSPTWWKNCNDPFRTAQRQEMLGKPAILLVSGPLRPVLAKFASYGVERLHVLSYQEIPDNKQITIVASVGQ